MTPSPESDRAVILLVEDEPLVRMLGADVLEDAGFAVVEAMDAGEALSQLEAHPEVRLLLTDVDMPGALDGLGLARRVHEERPDIEILIVSGKVRPGPAEIPDQGRFLPKPYDSKTLVRQVRELLTRH